MQQNGVVATMADDGGGARLSCCRHGLSNYQYDGSRFLNGGSRFPVWVPDSQYDGSRFLVIKLSCQIPQIYLRMIEVIVLAYMHI